ncbi:MAG TPA: FtsX-like permease family protein, partial [Candidatus Angelobacter sp.]
YMAVLQRTREIGILKSLGASKSFILEVILAEAVLLGAGGTVLGPQQTAKSLPKFQRLFVAFRPFQ